MGIFSGKYKQSGPGMTRIMCKRLLTAFLACLLIILCMAGCSYAILLYSDSFNRCVFEITTSSHANGWDKAELVVLYYDKDGKKQEKTWDIKDQMSEGDKFTVDLNESYARPYSLSLYLDFGGGMTVRNQSGKIKYIFQRNTIMEEEYSVWSYPFSSSDEWLSYSLPDVPVMMIKDDESGYEQEVESLTTAFSSVESNRKETIKLLSDVTLSTPIDVSTDNITLDLNGYAIIRKDTGANSTFDGRFFYIDKGAKLRIIDSKSDRDNGTSYDGGTLIDGHSKEEGGGIYIERGGALSMTGCTISNCDSEENGGAIYCRGELTLDGTEINYSDSEENGGAIFLTEVAKADLKDVTIDDCDADGNGGAIALERDAYAWLNNTGIVDCDADDYGGAVYMTGESGMHASGITLRNCKAEDGGAIYDGSKYQLVVDGSRIQQCKADDSGGGMFYQAGWLSLDSCEWDGCYAGEDGGGVYLVTRNGKDTSQHFVKQTFENCEAKEYGGALYIIDDSSAAAVAPTTLKDCTFKRNEAERGGGVYLESLKVYFINASVTGNTATGKYGGGIYVDSMKDIEVAGKINIRDNKSSAGTDNLSLQNGTASAAKIYSGGLYDGSYIGVSSTSSGKVTIAKNVSIFNAMKFIHPDKSDRTIRTDNVYAVMTPLVASIISENASRMIIIIGLELLAAVICFLAYKKLRKEAEGTDE